MKKIKFLFVALVLFHWYILLANIAAIPYLILFERWWLSVPLVSFLVRIMCERDDLSCPLTRWENKLRKKMDMPQIKGFIAHYILKKY